jgi:mannose-6-phosphate isomerase
LILLPELLKLSCSPQEKIWGGTFLGKQKKLNSSQIGETWEMSALSEGPSCYEGLDLPTMAKANQGKMAQALWGPEEQLTYLIKFIDTSDNLSIQVHPDDSYARIHEQSSGKTECWIILATEEGAGVYLGLKRGVTAPDFEKRLKEGGGLEEMLNFIPAQPGDFFYVPAGTVHALGKGLRLLEVQQSSGITYRVWDWQRTDHWGKPRELHVQKALAVINFTEDFNQSLLESRREQVFLASQTPQTLLQHPQFNVHTYSLGMGEKRTVSLAGSRRVRAIVCTQGQLLLHRGNCQVAVSSYETVCVPFDGTPSLTIESSAFSAMVLVD